MDYKGNKKYWNNFYEGFRRENETSFCRYIKSKINKETTIIDLGCGFGQDSWSFYKDGYNVVAVDQSIVAIDYNNKLKEGLSLCDSLEFINIDISSEEIFSHFIKGVIDKTHSSNKRILIYARFLLHSITENVENILMKTLSEFLSEGDLFAAEFRTVEDEKGEKVYTEHFRRYVNADELVKKFEYKFKFKIMEYEKGTGFSIYKEENPFLARILMRKSK